MNLRLSKNRNKFLCSFLNDACPLPSVVYKAGVIAKVKIITRSNGKERFPNQPRDDRQNFYSDLYSDNISMLDISNIGL